MNGHPTQTDDNFSLLSSSPPTPPGGIAGHTKALPSPQVDFYSNLFGDCLQDGRFIEFRRINRHEEKVRQEFFPSVEGLLNAARKQEPLWDYYFGIHPRDSKNGTSEAVKCVTCIWADCDWKNFEGGRAGAIKQIHSFPLRPTVVVESGNGFHLYWLLKEPEESEDLEGFRLIVKGVQEILGSDAVSDLPRILRIPGTLNYKDPKKILPCKIIFSDYTRRYVISDFEPFAILPKEDTESHKRAAKIKKNLTQGNRSNSLASEAGSMRRRGWTQDEIEAALQLVNRNRCQPPLPGSEVRKIAESIGRYAPADSPAAFVEAQEPEPLVRALPPPEPFPMEALGEVLGGAARVMAEVIQAPEAISGQAVLAAADLAVQAYANLVIDGRESSVSEFFLTIAETGERKTAVDNAALWPIRKYQRKLTERYEAEFGEYKRDCEAFEKAKKEVLQEEAGGGYEAKKRALGQLGDGPQDPVKPFLTCDDPTYEGLVKLLAVGRPSIGIFSDEGGRFIGGHGMKQENQLKTAAGLSHLWDGRAISRVRAGDGTALLPGRRVSFHLMAQPEVAQLMLSNTLLLEQGLLSRCLVTWPQSTAGSRLYRETDLYLSPEMGQYSARLLDILETPLPLAEGKQNELNPRPLPLEQDAKRAWIAFHDAVERKLAKGGTLETIKGLGNKAPEHAARLAAVLALVDDLHVSSISLEWMKAGIALTTHYLNEALRLFNAGAVSPELARAQKLLTWIQEDRKRDITLVEVYRFGPNEIRDAKTARATMGILEEHGWIIPLEDGAEFEGSRRREAWRVRK